jgi:hypothetical protein
MSSRQLLLLAVALSGCAEDPALLVHLEGRATTVIELAPPPETISAKQRAYRWEIVSAPEGSHEPVPVGEATAQFQPDLRGTYLIERWLTYGVGEDLTHRFVVDVSGVAPTAIVLASTTSAAVQTPVALDGTTSFSLEDRPLTYRWRIASRPAGSSTTVPVDGARPSFTPDLAGEYSIELSVFDGDLWNETPSTVLVSAH